MLNISMTLKKSSKIFNLRKEFNSIYPHLALHILKKPAMTPNKDDICDIYRTVGECCKKVKDGTIDISSNRKIQQVINDFKKIGIDVAICHSRFCYDYDPVGFVMHFYPALDIANPTLEEFNKPKKGEEDYYHLV